MIYAIQFLFVMYTADCVLERRIKSTFITYTAIAIIVPIFRQIVKLTNDSGIGISAVTVVISYLIIYEILYKGSQKRIILFTLAFMSLTVISEFLTQIMLSAFLNFRWKDYSQLSVQYLDYAIGYVFALEVLFVLAFSCLFLYQRKKMQFSVLELIFLEILLSYQLIASILFYYCCKEYNIFSSVVGLIMVLFSFAIDVYMPRFIVRMKESRKVKKQYQKLMEQRTNELAYYEKQYKQIEDFRILRHEFANYLQTVQELAVKNDTHDIAEDILLVIEKKLQ